MAVPSLSKDLGLILSLSKDGVLFSRQLNPREAANQLPLVKQRRAPW